MIYNDFFGFCDHEMNYKGIKKTKFLVPYTKRKMFLDYMNDVYIIYIFLFII